MSNHPKTAMFWKPCTVMEARIEFVLLALQEGSNHRQLCRNFSISPQTGYHWLKRYATAGLEGLLQDRSRRPLEQPARSVAHTEAEVVALRQQHPAWGGRKISRRLQDLGLGGLAPSTVTRILHRHDLISPDQSRRATPFIRFERDEPNALWQADFKGYVILPQGHCSPFTMMDDHSRFNMALDACMDLRFVSVQACMERAFRRYGLPVQINFDNGPPWGSPSAPGQLTELGVWLVLLGIRVTHSRPYHPQTNGKDERFHRSLKAEVLSGRSFGSVAQIQHALDIWRNIYNLERPHEALDMATPVTRYRPSLRVFPERLRPVDYGPDDQIVTVRWNGELRFAGQRYKVSSALHRHEVAVRPKAGEDGIFEVYLAHHKCLTIDLKGGTAR